MTPRTIGVAAICIAVLASCAGTARAGYSDGDPRQCANTDRYTCAKEAARLTLRHFLIQKEGFTTVTGVGCRSTGSTLLRWRCSFHDSIRDGVATVSFHTTAAGWTRRVTIVSLIAHWPCCSPG
jgi:hypothetical protein